MRHLNKAVSLAFRPLSFCCFGAIGLPPSRCGVRKHRGFFFGGLSHKNHWDLKTGGDLEIQKNPAENSFVLLSLFFSEGLMPLILRVNNFLILSKKRNILNLSSKPLLFFATNMEVTTSHISPSHPSHPIQEVPPMMRETQKDGPKDGLRPVSLEELKKHSHQAVGCRRAMGWLSKSHGLVIYSMKPWGWLRMLWAMDRGSYG